MFNVATNTVLGQGFYLTASPNEAKGYSCDRMRQRRTSDQDPISAMLVVVGVEDNKDIKGKLSPNVHLSDPKTGEPLGKEIYFNRKTHPNAHDIESL